MATKLKMPRETAYLILSVLGAYFLAFIIVAIIFLVQGGFNHVGSHLGAICGYAGLGMISLAAVVVFAIGITE